VLLDIEKLKTKVLTENKHDNTLNSQRDFPEITSKIIWITQIKQKLDFY